MTKMMVTYLGVLLAVHITTLVVAQNATTEQNTTVNNTEPAVTNASLTTATDNPSSSGVNATTPTGASVVPQSTALSLLLPVSVVGTLIYGRC